MSKNLYRTPGSGSRLLRKRLLQAASHFVECQPEPPEEPVAPGTSGALKAAFKRSVRYNRKQTTVSAPKPGA